MVHYKTFDNGLRLIVKQMPGLMSVTMGIIVHTGAGIETDRVSCKKEGFKPF